MSRELNGAETLMGFLGWLMSREEPVTFSCRHNATIAVQLLEAFEQVNSIGTIGPDWPAGLTHPAPNTATNAERKKETIMPASDDPALYAISGPGFSDEFDCLRVAIRALQAHKSGAVFQRLWSYQTFADSPGLMAEVLCDCDTCWKEKTL